MQTSIFALLFASPVGGSEANVTSGGYSIGKKVYTHNGMDSTGNKIHVWYPENSNGETFPFIAYAHGHLCGGSQVMVQYDTLLTDMAAYGYVIAAHEACNTGCSDKATLSGDPTGYANYYKQQLKVIDWAQTQTDSIFSSVNFGLGVGIAGHSMGGQATVYSSSSHGAGHNIKAAVMHHAYTHSYPAPTVPFLAFTGTSDYIAPSSMTTGFFNAKGASSTRGLVNKKGAGHMEPDPSGPYNKQLAVYSAAWFKLFLDGKTQEGSTNYHDMIFGSGSSSLCHGGDGSMQQCELHGGEAVEASAGCKGTDDFIETPACYGNNVMGQEDVTMKIESFASGAGRLSVEGSGATPLSCETAFSKDDSNKIAIEDCDVSAYATIKGAQYCSDTDELKATFNPLGVPIPVSVKFPRVACPSEAVAV